MNAAKIRNRETESKKTPRVGVEKRTIKKH